MIACGKNYVFSLNLKTTFYHESDSQLIKFLNVPNHNALFQNMIKNSVDNKFSTNQD